MRYADTPGVFVVVDAVRHEDMPFHTVAKAPWMSKYLNLSVFGGDCRLGGPRLSPLVHPSAPTSALLPWRFNPFPPSVPI